MMNAYRTPKTILENNLDKLASFTLEEAKKLSAAAAWLNEGHRWIWALPDAQLAELLNHLGPERVNNIMTDHLELTPLINRILDRADSEEANTRCILGAGRQITFADGAFAVVPLPQPDPEPNE